MPPPRDDYQTRQTLVEHAIQNMRSNFQGRGPQWQEVHEDMPRNLFAAGTLHPGDEGGVAEDLESEFGKTEYNPSAIGFAVRAAPQDALTVELSADFALYYPVMPSWADVQRFLARFDQGADQIKMPPKYRRVNVSTGPFTVTLPLRETNGFEECQPARQVLNSRLDAAQQRAVGDPELYAIAPRKWRKGKARLYPRAEVQDSPAWATQVAQCTQRVEVEWRATLLYRIRRMDEPGWLVEFFLCNVTPQSEWGVHETAFIGPVLRLVAKEGALEPVVLPEVEARDYRHEAWTWAAGRNCDTVVRRGEGHLTVETESLPLYVQMRLKTRDWSRPDGTRIENTFEALAGPQAFPILRDLSAAMHTYLTEWNALAAQSPNPNETEQIRQAKAAFEDEFRRFERGVALLADPANDDLLKAFQLMNASFARRFAHAAVAKAVRMGLPPPTASTDGWRLFQLVFIVSELEDLLHRDVRRGRPETPAPTVLWFPTGGGKTEAYLGLIVLHAFWDRLRGKPFGVTAFAKFPLRMLSLQQFSRVVDVIEHAEEIRKTNEDLAGKRGDPFSVGYYAGGDNTLNVLDFPVSPDRSEKRSGWSSEFQSIVRDPASLDRQANHHNKVTKCPTCFDATGTPGRVATTWDGGKPGFRHRCTACKRDLQLHLTDTEVLRNLPTLVIATIDKLARFATEPWGRAIFGEAHVRCPKHGYLLARPLRRDGQPDQTCPILDCTETLLDTEPNVDPVPGLLVQDELHLLTESLGAFASHYETMLMETARRQQEHGVGRGPWKVVGSTATIEGFRALVRQLYNHGTSRRFPVPGPLRTESFYARETDEPQRLILGFRSHGMSHVDAVMKVLLEWHRILVPIADLPRCSQGTPLPAPAVGIAEPDRLSLARRYRTAVTYGIRKDEVMRVNQSYTLQLNVHMEREGLPPFEPERVWSLTGDSDVYRLQRFLEEMESGSDDNYVQAATATSIISHGVDLDNLNAIVFRGVPHTMAEYIQAMSRVGRASEVPALVVNVYNPNRERDAAHFESHAKYLELRDILIRHVPTTRFSRQALEKTVPGLVLHYVNYESPTYNLWRRTTVDGLLAEVRDNYDDVVAGVKRRLGLNVAPDPDSLLVKRQAKYVEEELVARVRSKLQQRSANPNDSQYASERLGALRSLRETDVPIKIYSEGSLGGGDD